MHEAWNERRDINERQDAVSVCLLQLLMFGAQKGGVRSQSGLCFTDRRSDHRSLNESLQQASEARITTLQSDIRYYLAFSYASTRLDRLQRQHRPDLEYRCIRL
jgi:hypothetical protein